MAEPSENLILEAGSVKETEDMPMEEAWRDFLVSGRVNDYLRYRNAVDVQESSNILAGEEQPDGKQYCGDRVCFTGYVDWRI